jgi:3-oxoacyl-[acyl-carrier protein] reductase
MALAREGVALVVNGRDGNDLDRAAEEIRRETGATVSGIVADVTTEAGRAALLDACPEPDILINNSGGPPAGDFRDWSRDDWIRALDGNMLSAIELIKASLDGMIARRFGRVVNITSAAVKAPFPDLGLSNGARCGLTGFVAGLARQTVRHNVTINNLLPGTFETRRIRQLYEQEARSAQGQSIETLRARDLAAQPAGRFGDPEEFGAACAFLCGAKAGYITGQNLLLDGGYYPGTV